MYLSRDPPVIYRGLHLFQQLVGLKKKHVLATRVGADYTCDEHTSVVHPYKRWYLKQVVDKEVNDPKYSTTRK